MRIIDLSVPIKNPSEEEIAFEYHRQLTARVDYFDHHQTVPQITQVLGCEEKDLPNGYGWATESVTLTTHSGTHLDAPYHYYPTTDGKPAKTIDELPLDWFMGDGVVFNFSHMKSGETVKVVDLEKALEEMAYEIKDGDIVYLRFDADKKLGTPEYFTEFPGMSAEATHYLIDKGVKIIGTDAMGFDVPFEKIAENFKETQDPKVIWEAHRVGMHKEYCQIEKMANLDQLPSHGFKTHCFPISIYKASAGWVRPIAILND
ncbi:cyclase family protein [Solibacillus sp. FSL K6-1523]|uniref:cyclase family protein n=1 Tax=Solibacillus sp. FSL K6-1523 TaxID=2921471 RepID=UPI0030FC6A55